MPRFFFDITDGSGLMQDEEGLDLPDIERAKSEAVAALPDIFRETGRGVAPGRTITSCVRTEAGQTVFQATLSLQARDLP